MSGVTFEPLAWRLTEIRKDGSFGLPVVLRRGTITLAPEIKIGEQRGGYRAPDTFEWWNVEIYLPRITRWRARKHLRRNAHIALEFWTETDVQDDGYRYVHWLFPSLRWNKRQKGRTFAGTFMPSDDPSPDGLPVPLGGFWKTKSVPV